MLMLHAIEAVGHVVAGNAPDPAPQAPPGLDTM